MTTNAQNGNWSEWIEWNGGECPLPDGTVHQVRFRNGSADEGRQPETWHWNHDDCISYIIAYRYKLPDTQEVTEEEEEAWQDKEGRLIGGPRKAESFLMQAADLMVERGKQYDQDGGERSMGKTVAAFNTITGRDLTESEGWLLMSILKRVRQHSGAGYHKDSAEDAVAYAALEAEALERQPLDQKDI